MDSHLPDDAQPSGQADSTSTNHPDTRSTKSQRTPKPIVHADFVYNLPTSRQKTATKRPLPESNGTETTSDRKRRKSVKAEVVKEQETGKNEKNQEKRPDGKDQNKDVDSVSTADNDEACQTKSEPALLAPVIEIVNVPRPDSKKTSKFAKKSSSKVNGKVRVNGIVELNFNGVDKEELNGKELNGGTHDKKLSNDDKKERNGASDQLSKTTSKSDSFVDHEDSPIDDKPSDTTLNLTAFNDQDDDDESRPATKTPKTKKPTLMTYILLALSEHPDGMSGLGDIYEYIRNASERYRHSQNEWRSSVRNCLSSSRRFMKHPRPISNLKQRGALWALNPDHPANDDLISAPKDASKFLPREPQTPLTPKTTSKFFRINEKRESPMPEIFNLDDCSTLSGEDLSRRSYTPSSTRHTEPAQIRLSIVTDDQIQTTNAAQYATSTYPSYTPTTTTQNNQCQYVYYLPTTSTQANGRSMQIIVQQASGYKTFEETNGTPTENRADVVRYEASAASSSTYQIIESTEPLYTPNPYPPTDTWPEYGADGEQENWLPRPLAPKLHRVAESELRALNNSNSVYFQL